MRVFKFNSLKEWRPMPDRLVFDGRRRVQFRMMLPQEGTVWAEDQDGNALAIGAGSGQLDISFALEGRMDVYTDVPGSTFYLTDRTGVIERRSEIKLTSLENRRARNPEFEQMMAQMKWNEQRRDERLQDEIRKLRASVSAGRVTPAAAARQRVSSDDGASGGEPSSGEPEAGASEKGSSGDDDKGSAAKAKKSASGRE